ncbi:hypothetical protein ASG84_25765 [Rhodococcus sp. Leaf278]|uniref:hypothetical protein n=1 Tax=Rhodococcus sp. Leaf278 TaxID=1736319 RepID=UPI00070EB6F0|nr:hypothetical protein [Rhodococcus sp. Leaf278]KQU51508.1 hypothetical protein ASG84_25765 [Rhodococcus sp. Leaf278]
MADTDLLRSSRDGDQFHYYWAARRCLEMLRPGSDLVAVSIEGVAGNEFDEFQSDDGLEVIDIAEYRGSESVAAATSVVYSQLKHTTVRLDDEITMSELKKTLRGFGKKFHHLIQNYPAVLSKVRFEMVTNRLPTAKVRTALGDVAVDNPEPADPLQVSLLKSYLQLDDVECQAFCQAFRFDDRAPDLLPLIQTFHIDVTNLLPGSPPDGPLRLKEIIAVRATTRGAAVPEVRVDDVLLALGTDLGSLLPAPPCFDTPREVVERVEFKEIAAQIVSTSENVIVHAAGGVGKTVLTTSLAELLPIGSQCVTYDCFGAGGYRRSSEPRHEHKQGLIQIANELASRDLCNVVLPSASASAQDYMRIFMARLRESSRTLDARSPGGLLVIAIDAADNAVMAAAEFGSTQSFVVDILRERAPTNVRIVLLCRTERRSLLKPPAEALHIELDGFTSSQSAAHLLKTYPQASLADTREFHDRTGGNPRVQALCIDESDSVNECLMMLGEQPLPPQAALDRLIDLQIRKIRDTYHATSSRDIDSICQALASLRPRLPVIVIAQLYGIDPATIRSFVADLGRPLMLNVDVLQFRDEPTETWFRDNYKPRGADLDQFIERLRPLAEANAYVAASLPQILWDARRFDDLVAIALTQDGLPHTNDIERAEIEFQRTRFALNASLRESDDSSATLLALKIGSLTAGKTRRTKLITQNTDLAGAYFDEQSVEDLVANRTLRSDWPGMNQVYEGAILSVRASTRTAARNRLRSAHGWLVAWTRLPGSLHNDQRIESADIAEAALGTLNVDGPQGCADYLRRWLRPADVAFEPGLIVAARLIDAGRFQELDRLVDSSVDLEYLQLAIAARAGRSGYYLSYSATSVIVGMLQDRTDALPSQSGRNRQTHHMLSAIVWTLACAERHALLTDTDALAILDSYLNDKAPQGIASRLNDERLTTVKAWALRKMLQNTELDVVDLASPDLVQEMDAKSGRTQRLSESTDNITPLIPWARAWAKSTRNQQIDLRALFESLPKRRPRSGNYSLPYSYLRDVAHLGAELLVNQPNNDNLSAYTEWLNTFRESLPIDTLIDVIRLASRSQPMDDLLYATARAVSTAIKDTQLDADESTASFVNLARAIRGHDADEAGQYWAKAVDTADRIGDDAYERWRVIRNLSEIASKAVRADHSARRAYQACQLIEALYPYSGDSLDFSDAIRMVARFSPTAAVSTASRWTNRNVGVFTRVLDGLVNYPDSALCNHPLEALALTPLAPNSDISSLVGPALHAAESPQNLLEAFSAHDRAATHPTTFFDTIDELAAKFQLDLSTTVYGAKTRHVYQSQEYPPTRSSIFRNDTSDVDHRRERAEALIKALDLTNPADLDRARAISEESGRAYDMSNLADEIISQPRRTWATTINGIAANTRISFYHNRQLVDALLNVPDLPEAASAACRRLVDTLVHRFAEEILTNSWGPAALEPLSKLSHRAPEDLMAAAVQDLGTRNNTLNSTQYFTLAGVLGEGLSPDDALMAYNVAVADLEYLIEPETSDGPWTDELVPPNDVVTSLAGYLWTLLASPDEKNGWLATHSVKLLGEFELDQALTELSHFACGAPITAFVDHRLPFYRKHAEQRLFLALERISTSRPRQLQPFEQLLRAATLGGDEKHVLLRESARRTLLEAHAHNAISLTGPERLRLQEINQPSTAPVASSRHQRPHSQNNYMNAPEVDFHFMTDFTEHWIEPLARCFGADPHEVERLCSDLIAAEWPHYDGRASGDPRHQLDLFADSKTHLFKYDRPSTHDLNFYLSLHALMTVAGELIDTSTVYRESYSDVDDFTLWLYRERPTRNDGRWLADRRDATPSDQLSLTARATEDASWLESAGSPAKLLSPPGSDLLVVWQHATQAAGKGGEITTIQSALVSRSRAKSLLAAMQTADDSYDLSLPSHDPDDLRNISNSAFILRAWIDDRTQEPRADGADPRSGGITYPSPRPAPYIQDLLNVTPDEDERIWTRTQSDLPVFVSAVWDDRTDVGHGRSHGPDGSRLAIDPTVLSTVLRDTGMNLIVKATIERYRDDDSGRRIRGDDDTPIDRAFAIVVIDDNGARTEL